jgi:ribosomal-protein-alanine N-acetyltransferase
MGDGASVSWAICLADDPDLAIGYCGIHSANPAFCSLMIGYDLRPDHWGKGVALEAVSAMLSFCLARDYPFAINRVAATTDLDSQRSIALLKRLGLVEEGVLRQFGFWKGAFQDVRMFALLRSQWQTHALKASAKPLASPSA